MADGIIGRKLGMTQIFTEDGERIPVTVIEAGPCQVIQKKSVEKEGYNAIQLGFMEKKLTKVNKPLRGHFKKAGDKAYYYLREFRVKNPDDYKVGDIITVDIFKPGDRVDITGISKGKGFAGVMKRWGFDGGPASHGSMFHRAPGSIGSSSFPSRVFKGKRMPGHAGNRRVTVQNLKVVEVIKEENLLLVKGAVPGGKNGILLIKESVKYAP